MKGSGKQPKDYPVFVSPQKLEFIARLTSTHKQVLTIYNIYNTPVAYTILSTHPNNYLVKESKGVIQKQCCADVVIRAQDFRCLSDESPSAKHRLRVQLHTQPGGPAIGYRDVPCVLRLDQSPSSAAANQPAAASFAEPSGGSPLFTSATTSTASLAPAVSQRRFDAGVGAPSMAAGGQAPLPLGVTLALTAVCIGLLAMPLHSPIGSDEAAKLREQQELQQQQHHWFWSASHAVLNLCVSHHVKLVAAYALGLLTAALLRY